MSYAARKLIDPSLDAEAWARTKETHKAQWEKPKAALGKLNSPRGELAR